MAHEKVQHSRSGICIAVVVMVFLARTAESGVISYQCNGELDILFILDASDSIGLPNFDLQRNFAADVTSEFSVAGNAVQFSFMTDSLSRDKTFPFKAYQTNQELRTAILRLPYRGEFTNITAALHSARTFSFTSANGARDNVPKIAIVIIDGQTDIDSNTEQEATLLKNSGVSLIFISVNPTRNQLNVISFVSAHGLSVERFEDLTTIKNELVKLSCTVCISNHGVCVGKPNGNYRACIPECKEGYYYSCSNDYTYKRPCPLGYYVASNGTRFTARLVYDHIKDACEYQAEYYCPRNPEDHPVTPSIESKLSTLSPNRPCLNKGDSCKGNADGNYAKCYPECKDGFYIACSGGYDYNMPCNTATYTDENGVEFQARMVYDPSSDSCQRDIISCPRELGKITPSSSEPPVPTIIPPVSTTPPRCYATADILLIIDSSASIDVKSYSVLIKFVADLTSNFEVGPNDVSFSAIIFSTNASVLFKFSAYTNNTDVILALLRAPHLEQGTNTGSALSLARNTAFLQSNGARSNAIKIAIIFTDGLSNDPNATATEAQLLKNNGVKMISVGVGDKVQKTELLTLASSDSLVFEVDNFTILSSIRNVLVTSACNDEVSKQKQK